MRSDADYRQFEQFQQFKALLKLTGPLAAQPQTNGQSTARGRAGGRLFNWHGQLQTKIKQAGKLEHCGVYRNKCVSSSLTGENNQQGVGKVHCCSELARRDPALRSDHG